MRRSHRGLAPLLVVLFLTPPIMSACGKTIGDTIDDATTTTRVKTALLNDPAVTSTDIDVDTQAGIVTLSGKVRSKAEADRALQVVRTVPGVKEVKSQLTIGSEWQSPASPTSVRRGSVAGERRSRPTTR